MKFLTKKKHIGLLLTLLITSGFAFAQNEADKIEDLISQKRSYNQQNKNTIVYKIQLYNGVETEAYKIESNFKSVFPEYKTNIIYKQPEWKTQVGNFETKLEADRVLLLIKEEFSGAIVLEDLI
ncbi:MULTISPECIES: SPOR domain-containing protein [Flavobacteriaceae]|uniref:SPOR domain-containing protein n=2 Tax=Flavobacteriaceae TaxID=49546 RepID=A0A4Y8AQM3_9FLAO|nr:MULTISPECIES: SPOR domain-containing protein [Flavobacteriaceae]TEW72454.1 SPOR domain-containing protein [Gramella jeungdoensis]